MILPQLFDPDTTPPLLLLLIQLCVLCLPLAAVIAALFRVRYSDPPKAAWMCIGAGVALFFLWVLPPSWTETVPLPQLKSAIAVGLYVWVLFDWYRTAREAGPARIDLLGIALIFAMLAMAGYAALL